MISHHGVCVMVICESYVMTARKEITSQTDLYLVSLSSKTYKHVFEDKLTKY